MDKVLALKESKDSFVNILRLCQEFKMSRQNYYKEKKVRQKKLVNESLIVELVKKERLLQSELGGRKLIVRTQDELVDNDVDIGRDRFFDVLRKNSFLIAKKRNKSRTTDSRHGFYMYKNLLKDVTLSGPGQAWVSDITYIRTADNFVYLSLITDAYSRKIIGYDCGDTLEATGCMRALKKAMSQLPAGFRPIHHSDRGSQYCCHDYINLLKGRKIQVSMTEENHCYENAMAERVNGILKHEYGLKNTFRTKKQAISAIRQAIMLYNEFRPHYMLKMKTPSEVHKLAA
jgi:transposase InsO family protein